MIEGTFVMIGIDMTFIRKTEINKGFFSEGISIYCEQILRGIEKVGQVNLFVLLVFKDQEKTIKHLFPNYVIRVIDSLFIKFIRNILGDNRFTDTEHKYLKRHLFAEATSDLDCVWFPYAIDKTFCKCMVPTISTIHDLILYQNGTEKEKKRYKEGVINCSDRIVAISKDVKKELEQVFFYKKVIDIVPNAVEHKENAQLQEIKEIANRSFILDVNAFTKRKNTLTLLRAYKLLQKYIEEDLVLCGGYKEEHYYDEIQQYILTNSLENNVHIFFNVNEKEKIYLFSKAKLFVMPSLMEGFGRTPIEAGMWKVPIVCSDIPVLREVTLGNAFYYSPADDERALANTIQATLKHSKNAKELEQISIQLQKYYSIETCAMQYITIFKQFCL